MTFINWIGLTSQLSAFLRFALITLNSTLVTSTIEHAPRVACRSTQHSSQNWMEQNADGERRSAAEFCGTSRQSGFSGTEGERTGPIPPSVHAPRDVHSRVRDRGRAVCIA